MTKKRAKIDASGKMQQVQHEQGLLPQPQQQPHPVGPQYPHIQRLKVVLKLCGSSLACHMCRKVKKILSTMSMVTLMASISQKTAAWPFTANFYNCQKNLTFVRFFDKLSHDNTLVYSHRLGNGRRWRKKCILSWFESCQTQSIFTFYTLYSCHQCQNVLSNARGQTNFIIFYSFYTVFMLLWEKLYSIIFHFFRPVQPTLASLATLSLF